MIIGIGIDLVEVQRVKSLLKKLNLGRIFTTQEIRYCRSKKNSAESFAARFAAKEAFFKAISTGWPARRSPAGRDVGGDTAQSPKWNEIEVQMRNLRLSGKAKSICQKLKVIRTHLSLTHTKDYVMAFVILEGK